MSGQNAAQADEFDSTNDRLDSILDALNALGGPSTPPVEGTKTAEPPALHVVPDLDEGSAPVFSDREEDADNDSVEIDDVVADTDLVPPAIPSFDIEIDESDAPQIEPFESKLGAVDAAAFSTPTTSIDSSPFEMQPSGRLEEPVPPAQVPAVPEVGEALDVDVSEVSAFEVPEVPEVSAFEVPEALDVDVSEASAFEVPAVPEAGPFSELSTVFEPSFDVPAVPEVSPVDADSLVEPSEFATAPTSQDDEPDQLAEVVPLTPTPQNDVAETTTGTTTSFEPVPRPQSIFRTQGVGESTSKVETPAPTEAPDTEWVSHDVIEPAVQAPIAAPFAAADSPETQRQLEGDALWHVEPFPESASEPASTPFFVDPQIERADTSDNDLWNTVNETEAMLSSLSPEPGVDGNDEFAALAPENEAFFNDAVAPVTELHPASASPSAIDGVDEELAPTPRFDTDEDLPIPDFSGVFDESPADAKKWNVDNVLPVASVEGQMTQTTAMMRRDELDRLRPPNEAPVEELRSKSNGANKKFFLTLTLALILVLALFVFPGVLEL